MLFGLSDLICALTRTSIFGNVYAARALNDVITGSVTWHADACVNCDVAVPVPRMVSGRFLLVSHVSRTPRPVLVPPWNVSPSASRAFTDTLTPCQYCVRASPKSVSNVRLVCAPVARSRDETVSGYPPAFATSGCWGAVNVHGV